MRGSPEKDEEKMNGELYKQNIFFYIKQNAHRSKRIIHADKTEFGRDRLESLY